MSWDERPTIRPGRRSGSLLAACMMLALCAPAASADFAAVTPPASTSAVDGFAASRGAWLVAVTGGSLAAIQARISHDHGQTWSDVALPAGPSSSLSRFSGIAVGPDGAFYVAARYPIATAPGAFGRLLRIDPADGSASTAGTLPIPADSADSAVSAPAFDAQGRLWVAWIPSGSPTLTVARIAAGAAAETYQAPAPATALANGEIQFRSSGMWLRMGDKTYRLSGGALVLESHGIPSLEDGSLVVAEHQISLDGGVSFLDNFQGADAVEGDPALLATTTGIVRRYSPAMFSATAQTWPADGAIINRVVASDGGLVALSDEWRNPRITTQPFRMLWHPGAVTDPPFSTGPLSATFTSWLTQADEFRAQAGLPPLLGDSAIAIAAENHSRYWTLNPHVGDAHFETPGAPGFTGYSPSDRCAAVGAAPSCSEVMYSLTDPVRWWVSTAYHRSLIMGPHALRVGGGQVPGGAAVMDSGQGGGLQIGPVMFPNGTYTGPLSWGGEFEDPAGACRNSGQQVDEPLGTSISVSVPGGALSGFTLSPAGGSPLRACTFGGLLLPDDGLLPGTTYRASVQWAPTVQMAPRAISWEFTTAAGPGSAPLLQPAQPATPAPGLSAFPVGLLPQPVSNVPGGCTPSLARAAARVTRPRMIAARVRACGKGVATIGVYRLRATTARQRRALAHKSVAVPAAGTLTLRLATRHLRSGRFALRISLKATKAKKLNTTITVASPRTRARQRR